MNHVRLIGEPTPATLDFLHLGLDVIGGKVDDRSGSKLFVLRSAQVEPHTAAIEEGHRLAGNLEQEFEAEDVSIPRHRAVDVVNADVELAKPGNHESDYRRPNSILAIVTFLS